MLGLSLIGLTTSSVNGLSTKQNTSSVTAKISLTTHDATQKSFNFINMNPFGEVHKMNFSNLLLSQVKHLNSPKPGLKSMHAKIRSDMNNFFKLPIDIPFP